MAATAMAMSRDPVADAFEATERRLKEWGAACGRLSEEGGVARSAGIRKIIEHVQRAERIRKEGEKAAKEQKKAGPKRRECLDCRYVSAEWGAKVNGRWSRCACPNCGSEMSREREITAQGKETHGPEPLSIQQLSYAVMQIDALVATLPGWMQQPVRRRYAWDQPDRFAADELRIDEVTYRQRLKAGIIRVAELLAARAR